MSDDPLGVLVVPLSILEEAKDTGRLELDHHRGRIELWKAARAGNRLILLEADRGRALACRIADKSIQRPILGEPLHERPWSLGLEVLKWGGGQEHDVREVVHDRFPFRPFRHIGGVFHRLWRVCGRPVQSPTVQRVPPRLRGLGKRYAVSVALTAEEHRFVDEIGELHPHGPTQRDQKFAFVVRRDGVLCGAAQVGLPRPNAPRHRLAASRFGDDYEALRGGAVSIVRLLARADAISRFAVHRALLEEICDVAPNMVRPELTYIDGASYQYHPLAPKFGFAVESPRRSDGAYYFWRPYNVPRHLARHADPRTARASRRRPGARQRGRAENEMRTWIVRASNDKNVREAVRRRLWALVDSSVNTARWTKVGKGDTVLFVRGDRITHIARVRSTDRSTKPVFAKYPLLIHFAAIDPCQPGLGLTDHMDGDSLREIRRAKGGIVEARGLDVSRLSREGEPAAASPRTAKRTPATAPATPPKARSRARRTSAPVATEPADDPPAPPIERASDAPKPMEPAQPKPAQPKPAQSKPVVAEQPKTPVRPVSETSPPLASGSPLPSRRRRRARLQRGKSITGYALRKRLGRGQSAEVWLADVEVPPEGTDLIQGQQVAIKFYLTTLLHWQRQAIRIQREFLVASEIEHHHIVRVHDLVLSPNRPLHSFLVMDYVEGQTLKDLLEDKGALQPRQVAEIGRQLFDALVALHTLDALHRDIKVANVMVKHQPADQLEVVLLDLGIVSVASESGVTGTSVIVGSPHYASLEQLRGEELSVRSDIYGVGATLFHLYTGRAMYAGLGAIGAIVAEMMTTPARLPPDAVTGAERALVDFINRCIENEARHRPRNAEAALEELGGVLAAMEAEAPAGRSKV